MIDRLICSDIDTELEENKSVKYINLLSGFTSSKPLEAFVHLV